MRELRFFILVSLCVAAACGDDATPLDASIPGDVGFDGEVATCETANDCSDGLFCTGEETCQAGVCVPGVVVDCDDGIECTIDGCNEIANRCESLAPDLDEDGSGDMRCVDALGEPLGRDCDDSDPRRFGGNLEVCDLDDDLQGAGLDEDCDATTFGAVDADGDNYFDARCFNTDGDGVRAGGDDCNDGRRDVNPAASETCDHVDNNCDGNVDEGVLINVAPDADRDGFPVDGESRMECPGFAGLVAIDDDTLFDCDDANPTVNPGQVEICDLIDNDCNLVADDNTQIVPWYGDSDGDGFGSAATRVVMSCEPVADTSILNTDCDDDNAAIHPAAAEACDGIDNDCNGRADYEITPGDFEDDDGDGSADIRCGAPRGVDCDDQDASTGGGTPESCDGRDNDCDDNVDEGATEVQWFYDGDRDGHGTNTNPAFPPVLSCSPPARYVGSAGDCNDRDPARSPDATEDCNSVDDDCDGAFDEAPAICDCAVGTMDCDADARGICETLTDSDPNNCGGCGNLDSAFDCAGAPNVSGGFCIGGVCVGRECDDGFDDCGPTPGCETPVSADPMNCGSCGRQCDGPNVQAFACTDGECQVTCDDGFLDCDGNAECIPESRLDCGDCGVTCGIEEDCVMGSCEPVMCGGGEQYCDGACTDTNSDDANCGDCGVVCPSGISCVGGACDCLAGGVVCNGVCVSADSDPNNCGACGVQCSGPESCNLGVCGCPPTAPLRCGNTCVDPLDANHCGGCGNVCTLDQTCEAPGRCECNALGATQCDGGCVDTDNDPTSCGGCGNDCGVGGACNLGVCDPILKVVQGRAHTCALRGSGAVVCWGENTGGQVDANDMASASIPVPRRVPEIPFATDISAGDNHTCAIAGGLLWCWGDGTNAALGREELVPVTGYATSPTGGIPVRVYSAGTHSCVVDHVEVAQCWGFNDTGQSGGGGIPIPDTVLIASVPSVFEPTAGISIGESFTCLVDASAASVPTVRCFGDNTFLQLGDTAAGGVQNPTPVELFDLGFGASNIPQVAGGDTHSCAVLGGQLDCWGGNGHGQCDPATMGTSVLPNDTLAFPFANVTQCSTRDNATCVLAEGRVWCAGSNYDATSYGVLDPSDTLNADVPWTEITSLGVGVRTLGVGGDAHSCVIGVNGGVFCWGRNDEGQLGIGASPGALPPRRVFALTP